MAFWELTLGVGVGSLCLGQWHRGRIKLRLHRYTTRGYRSVPVPKQLGSSIHLGVQQIFSYGNYGYIDSTDKVLFFFYRSQTQYTEEFLIETFNCGEWTNTTAWEVALADIAAWSERTASDIWDGNNLVSLLTLEEYTAYTAAGHPPICDGLELELTKTRDFLHSMGHCARGQRVEVEVLGAVSVPPTSAVATTRSTPCSTHQTFLRTRDSTFLLPKPRYVEGSFFTDAYWTVRTSLISTPRSPAFV
jgi:hypothetical protein